MCPIHTRPIQSVPLQVRRDGPLPIADQIADQLLAQIRTGSLRPGDRLPPVRVLAGFLRINRNTVAKVYAALERRRVLVTTPGRGTFVGRTRTHASSESVAALVDRFLTEAAAQGLRPTDVRSLIAERAAMRETPARPRVGFVECNPSDLAYFSRLLEARLPVPLTPVLLSELSRLAGSLDVVATTLFHVEEVRRLVPGKEVVGLMALPEFQTLDAVAHLPARSRVALVCATQEGVKSKERSIRAVGIQRAHLMTATLPQPARVQSVLKRADVVLASPKVLERIQDQIPPKARVIPFGSVLGEGALALLEERIRDWRPRARETRRSKARRLK